MSAGLGGLERAIFRAIADPGATQGMKGDDRTLTQWQTDAVMAVLAPILAEVGNLYALGLLVEEAGEIAQAVGKALRFGLDSPGPDAAPYHGRTARQLLNMETGDMAAATLWATADGVLDEEAIADRGDAKLQKLLSPDSRDNLGRRLAPEPRARFVMPETTPREPFAHSGSPDDGPLLRTDDVSPELAERLGADSDGFPK